MFGETTCRPEMLLFGGDYELGVNSNTARGAQKTRFSSTLKLGTPTGNDVDFLKQWCDQYPGAPGIVQDVAKDGCDKLFVLIETCPVEFNLTAIADGTLRLGDWSNPLCTPDARPVNFQAFGFVRE
jgi:hypothetical protein